MKLPEIAHPHRPEWAPLIKAGLQCKDYMFMGKIIIGVIWIFLYKHTVTRRYINLDGRGGAYALKNGKYSPITLNEAITYVQP